MTDTHPPRRRGIEVDPADRFISRRAAADFLGVSPRTVDKLIIEGQLPAWRIGRVTVRIRVGDVRALAKPVPAVDREDA